MTYLILTPDFDTKNNMKKLTYSFTLLSAITLAACGGSSTEETGEKKDSTATTQVEVVKPDPVTTVSGSEAVCTLGVIGVTDKEIKYTLVDFTTNASTDGIPFEEYHEPEDDEQLVVLNVSSEVVRLANLTKYSAPDGFSIVLTEGAEKIKACTRFTGDFAESLKFKDAAVGESQTVPAYFIVPADADLSQAYLSIYLGSDVEPVKLNLYNN